MSDSLSYQRKSKFGGSKSPVKAHSSSDMQALVEKVEKLEQSISMFRSEVDMKLKIIQQILSTRNEQVSTQRKLLQKEEELNNILFGHWTNVPKLAASGLAMNFSAPAPADDLHCSLKDKPIAVVDVDDNSSPSESEDFSEPDDSWDENESDISPGPSPKKPRSSLRRKRKSVEIYSEPTRKTRQSSSGRSTATSTRRRDARRERQRNRNLNRHDEAEGSIHSDNDANDSAPDFSDNEEKGQHDSETAEKPRSKDQRTTITSKPRVNHKNPVFVSAVGQGGKKIELRLPETLISQLQRISKERTIINHLLRHLYSMDFLRACSLTGNSNLRHDGTEKIALPPDMVTLIQEAVKKFLPPTQSPESPEGKKLISAQRMKTRSLLTTLFQYYRDEYNDDGSVRGKRLQIWRDRKNKSVTSSDKT